MLADVLLADYTARGFEPVVMSEDVEEGDNLWTPNSKQVFHYDDFLGRVSLGELALRKNEENRLSSFFARVRRQPDKRMIMTTREYILSEARNRYERLYTEPFEAFTYVLSLGDYTRLIKAEIVYSHLWHSRLPVRLRRALLPGKRYREVISHPHFSPRIIEQIIALPGNAALSAAEFRARLFGALDDPSEVWERIYENLPTTSRALLLALATLPNRVMLDDLELVARPLLASADPDLVAFRAALRMLEGTFIRIEAVSPEQHGAATGDRVVAFRDPSVADYLRRRIAANFLEAKKLLQGAIYFDQLPVLWDMSQLAARTGCQALTPAEITCRGSELFTTPSVSLTLYSIGGHSHWGRSRVSAETRATFLTELAAAGVRRADALAAARSALEAAAEGWATGRGDKADALRLLGSLAQNQPLHEELPHTQRRAYEWFARSLGTREDWSALVRLSHISPSVFADAGTCLEAFGDEFARGIAGEVGALIDSLDDPNWLEEESDEIRKIGSAVGVDVERYTEQLVLEAARRREDSEHEVDEDPHAEPLPPTSRAEEDRLIDGMFSSLQ